MLAFHWSLHYLFGERPRCVSPYRKVAAALPEPLSGVSLRTTARGDEETFYHCESESGLSPDFPYAELGAVLHVRSSEWFMLQALQAAHSLTHVAPALVGLSFDRPYPLRDAVVGCY